MITIHVGDGSIQIDLDQAELLIDALRVQHASLKASPGWVGVITIDQDDIEMPIYQADGVPLHRPTASQFIRF